MLLLFISGMTALVGIIGLSGMLSLNVLERAREIGIMRLIGGSNQLLNKLIISEGTLLMIIAWGIGLIFSLPLTAITGGLLGEALFATPLTLCVNSIGIGIWLVLSILASFISGIFPCIKMNRMVTRDVLSAL